MLDVRTKLVVAKRVHAWTHLPTDEKGVNLVFLVYLATHHGDQDLEYAFVPKERGILN